MGASGAIAGIIASHLVLFPDATLGSLAPVLFLRVVESTPTFLLLLLWLVAQFFSSVAALAGNTSNRWLGARGRFRERAGARPDPAKMAAPELVGKREQQ